MKRILSILLCLCMVLTMLPMATLAAENANLASYYSTNKAGTGGKKTITVDGDISDWDSSMLIAQGTANDDPRVYRPNSMYENPIDLYALYGAYDNENLYLMWEMTNVQDVVAPNDTYPLSQGVLYQTMNLPLFIAIDTRDSATAIGNNGGLPTGGTFWDSGITFGRSFNKLIATSTNGANGPFLYGGDSTGLNPVEELAYKEVGLTFKYGLGILSKNVYGIDKAYGEYNNRVIGDMCNEDAAWVDFNTMGHSTDTMDFHYELSIPLSKLGTTAAAVAEKGLGVMLVMTSGKSGMDCLPYDLSMNDLADLDDAAGSQENNSFEKSDEDHITAKFAQVGGTVVNDDNDETQPTVTQPVVTDPIVTDPIVTDPIVTDPIVTEPVVTEPIIAPSNTIYLKVSSDWKVDGARFAAYFWDGNGNETWADATDSDGDGYYEVVLPGGAMNNVIFVRMNGSTTANNWDNKWNQTGDLKVPTDGKNCFVLDAGWNGTGSWTTYTPSGYECPHTSHNTSGKCTACGAAVSHKYVSGTCSVCGGKDPNYVTPSDPTDPTDPTNPTTPIEPEVPSNIQDGVTLHCWNWSYKGIEANMAKIAAQGYTAIQTSPIQQAKEATVGNGMKSHWWVYYQPMGFHIDQTTGNALGTKAEFESMCATAHKYGVKVIVDVVANHLGNQTGNNLASTIIDDLKNDSSCWHDITKNTTNYNDRYDITQHCMAGLPDLNTANKKVQNYALGFLKECIDSGADGFRFDGAKHIETPDDSGCGSDFWPYVINGATEYAKSSRGIDLYCYGEVLDQPGGGLSISAYTKYMSVTDNSWGNSLRGAVNGGNAGGYSSSYHKGAKASKLVVWNESHDTYANEGSGNVSTQNINKTWALAAARADVMGLYFARPSNYASQKLGEASVTGWANPEFKAVNDFHNAFVGQTEYLANQNGIAYCERGTQGVVLVNCNGGSASVNVTAHKMAAGTYVDTISGNTFTVSNGKISGNIGSTGIAVVYSGEEPCKHPTHNKDGICPECNGTVNHTYSNGFCTVCGAEKPQLTGDFYLFGWINGANYACEEDAANLGQYKLVGGTLTTTFEQDSYVAVKTGDNANWYMTNGFQGLNTSSVVLYNTNTLGTTADKMHVPGGKKVTFTLVDNGDGSYTLSYADANAHQHSYTATVTTPAGCETAGVKTYKCSCGHSYTEAIAAIGHKWTDATCTAPKTCSVCGTMEGTAAGHKYVDGTCSVCGAADPNYVKPVVQPTITLKYPTLSFESEVFYNIYYTASNTADVVEMGLLTWYTRPEDSASATINTADAVIPGYDHNADADIYMVRSLGVPAKQLGDNVYMRVYAKLSDGTYAYSSVTYYSAKFYAASIFGNSTNENMKALCVAMLNYGAAAQVHFDYKTDDLMNSVLSAEQKAMVKDYSSDMIGAVVAADPNKVGTFKSNGGFSGGYPSVSFEGAFSINYYLTPKNAVDGDITLYCWDLATYNSVSTLTEANATAKITMTKGSNLYVGAYEGIAAKQIDETVFVAGVYTSGGTRYSSPVISYSLGAYCAEQIANGSATMQEFAKSTAVYGNYAKAYFASLNG